MIQHDPDDDVIDTELKHAFNAGILLVSFIVLLLGAIALIIMIPQ